MIRKKCGRQRSSITALDDKSMIQKIPPSDYQVWWCVRCPVHVGLIQKKAKGREEKKFLCWTRI